MIILFLLVLFSDQTLIYEYDANTNNLDDWQSQDVLGFNTCGGISYMEVTNSIAPITRIFQKLESHSQIQLDLEIFSIYQTDYIYILLDYQHMGEGSSTTSSQSICTNSHGENYFHQISKLVQHNRLNAWISLEFKYGGLIKFKLSITECQSKCTECIENYPIICQQWKLHQYSINSKFITNTDGWTGVFQQVQIISCGNCQYLKFQVIKYTTLLPPHQNILIRFFKIFTSPMTIDYVYGKQISYRSHQLIEILIENHPNSILNLELSSQNFIYIRDFEVFYSFEDVGLKNLIEGCLEQIKDQCVICKEGWVLHENLWNCIPLCGDIIIQGYEQCDDGNSFPYDGCFNCKYSCCEFCISCQFGNCVECQEGFIINQNYKCDPLCGDGKVIPYSAEQCDIETDENQDGCLDCRFTPITNCIKNHFLYCFECEKGFQIQENVCLPYCGDKIILEQYEDCDDGNLEPYDGCYECKFQCIEGCNICDKGNCRLYCNEGYEFATNICLSICGDNIITKDEDCDDGNKIQYDGCFNCKYSCPLNCNTCYQGICLECKNQLQLSSSNLCEQKQICGDGFLQENEQCDDGNDQAADGCQNCLIQNNWKCSTIKIDSPTLCIYSIAPNLFINYINMTQNTQYIRIQFDQQVKIETQQPLSKTITFELLNVKKTNWNSSLYIIQDVGSDVSFGEYVLELEVFQLLEFRPVLKIEVIQVVYNIDNIALSDYSKQITLQYPMYLNEEQIDYSQNLKKINKYMIYGLFGITWINLLFGSGDLFVEILAILQFQQYLRYINLQFPLNLEIYFSINDMITIQPLLDFISVPYLLKQIHIQEGQKYSDGKFKEQTTNLLINLSPQICQCLLFLIIIVLLKWIKAVLYNRKFISKYFKTISCLSLNLSISLNFFLKISQFFYDLCIKIIKLEQFMSFSGLQKALLLNGWDMIFKIVLYSRNIQTINYFEIVQILLLIVVILLYFTIILNLFNGQQHFLYLQFKINKHQRFEILKFTRSLFFLLFLIYLQISQILQLGFLLITSIFQIKIIINHRKIYKKQKFIVQIVVELSVFIFMFSSFLYIQEFQEFFNEQKKIILGWIHIIILSQGLIINLIIIFYESCVKLKQKMCRKQKLINKPRLQVLDAVEN